MKKKDNGLSSALDSIMGMDADYDETSQQSAPQTARGQKKKDYSSLPNNTTSVSFRVPKPERIRLEQFMQNEFGLSLAAGLKKIVYDYVNGREK